MRDLVDEEIRVLIDRCYDAAVVALNEHRAKLDALADALLAKETLDEEEAYHVAGVSRPAAPRPLDGSRPA